MSSSPIAPVDLEALGSALLRGLPLRPGHPAQLVHVSVPGGAPERLAPDDDVDLGVACLEPGDHPLDALVGSEAPPEWVALGVVAVGTVLDAADPSLLAARVRSVHLVERGGSWAAALAPLDGTRPAVSSSGPPGPEVPHGRIDDALRLALGLPTRPPAGDTLELFALQWLDRLVDEAAQLPPADLRLCTAGWAVSRHPAVEALGLRDAAGTRLVAEGRRLATWRDWPQLRRMCAAGTWSHPDITPHDAAWLDDGAFSRWAPASWPELPALTGVVDALLPLSTAAVVRDALEAWGLVVCAP